GAAPSRGRAQGKERAPRPDQRGTVAEEPRNGRIYLRRVARPPGTAADPDRVLGLSPQGLRRPAGLERPGIRALPCRRVAADACDDLRFAPPFPGGEGDRRPRGG